MQNRWGSGPGGNPDELDLVVYLSNQVGLDEDLVQPGGGNTSVKLTVPGADGRPEPILAVKGSGTDLRTIEREGFTRLSMAALGEMRQGGDLTDEAMMSFMRGCMLNDSDPVPSVETPLHSILPYKVIAHTHDVPTMGLTNIPDERARQALDDLFGGDVFYVPYVRPGYPLAKLVMEVADSIPANAKGLALAHHGLCAWADDVEECYRRLIELVSRVESFVGERKGSRRIFGPPRVSCRPEEVRKNLARTLLPVIRGELSKEDRVVLHFDDSEPVLDAIGSENYGVLSQRGVSTPEHILRAGRLPLWLDLDLDAPEDALIAAARDGIQAARDSYLEYHARHASEGESVVEDWAKVVLVPGLGMITAFKDKKSAVVANTCYRAGIRSIEVSEAVDEFSFITEEEVFEFEHWPLERRKVEETIKKERESMLLPRAVALVFGGASGIGAAAVQRFAAAGAHVVVADLDEERGREIAKPLGPRASFVHVDAREEDSIAAAVEHAVMTYGGLDSLFYTVGVPPRFATITDIRREDLESQIRVHYVGAVLAIREAARVMIRQGCGGSITCSVSKAALAPGKEAVAYGSSKAAMLQALRVAALELGEHGIRVNSINADQIDTPLFRSFVKARADAAGKTYEEQLEEYKGRNAMGLGLIPADAVGDLAVLLASDRFQYTTGDILTIDGGLKDAFPR